MFYNFLLPNGAFHTVSPAYNTIKVEWVAGLGGTLDAQRRRRGVHVVHLRVRAREGLDGLAPAPATQVL